MNSSFNEIVCPFEAEWKFHKADLLDLKNSEDGCLNGKCCYAYNIPGLKYFVAIYINGNAKGSCGQTWIAFHVNGSEDRKVTAEFTLSVESANYSKNLNYVYEKSIGHGTYFCKTEKFFNSKFFVNGELTIKVKGTLKTERPLISKICAPISMQWKVKEADLKSKKESSGCLYSKRINVASFSGVKYYLAIRPKFIIDENESRTQLCLHLSMEKKKKIEAVYDFSIDSANFNCGSQYVYDKSKGHGLRLYSTEDIFDPSKKYIVDGYLTINLNGILIAEKNQLFTSISENDIEPKFNLKILAAKSVIDAKDFKILIDENEIPVHKKLLMNISPVLKGMFESGMKESIENKMVIKDFEFKIVEAAIKYLYGTNVLKEFLFEEMLLLYRFGDKYEIKHIMDLVEGYLIKEMSPSNVVQLIKFSSSDALNIRKLYQKCIDFFIKCSKESTPVLGSESLDEKLLVSIFMKTFRTAVDTFKMI